MNDDELTEKEKVKKFDEMLARARKERLRRFLGNRYGREGC